MSKDFDPNKYRYTPDIFGWQEAVWAYMLDHCDITEGGTFFIKFHTENKQQFMNHIRARWKHNYHRNDPVEKNKEGQDLKAQHHKEKEEAKARWQEKKKRHEVEWRRKLRSYIIKLVNRYI